MILLVFSLVVNFVAQPIVRRLRARSGRATMSASRSRRDWPRRATGSRRRRAQPRHGGARLARALRSPSRSSRIVVVSVAAAAASELNLDLLHEGASRRSRQTGGGIANAFVGTLVIVALATAIALPVGILVAIYVTSSRRRGSRSGVRLALDVLNGVPSIVIGIFVYGAARRRPSVRAASQASFALAILMLPLVARSTIEVLALVPNSLREAALGSRRHPLAHDARDGAAAARSAASSPARRSRSRASPARPRRCSSRRRSSATRSAGIRRTPCSRSRSRSSSYSESPDPADHARAWAAALVLLLFILFASLGRAWLATRSRRKLGRSSR